MRRDPDNICFAKKFILDGLGSKYGAGVIEDDGWRCLSTPNPFHDSFFIDKEHPRVVITVTEH
jgi:hypothetical protein